MESDTAPPSLLRNLGKLRHGGVKRTVVFKENIVEMDFDDNDDDDDDDEYVEGEGQSSDSNSIGTQGAFRHKESSSEKKGKGLFKVKRLYAF